MINLTINSSGPAAQAAPIAAGNGAPAAPQDTGTALPFADQPFVARPFADLLGQLDLAGAVDSADAQPADGNAAAEPAPASDGDEGDSDAGRQPVLTPAMTMAMPLLPAALAAANAVANAVAAATARGTQAGAADGQEQPAAPVAAIPAAAPAGAIQAAAAIALQPVAEQAPRAPLAARPVPDAAAGTVQAAASTPRTYAATVPAGTDSDLAARIDATATRDSASVNGATLAAPAPAAQRDAGADTVALPGPPAAWRQSLREALGERLQMQAGRGLEQAVIRLDPPQLGRVEIAIRHSAGSLEVTLSATHGEVLRQLHAVSDNLRSDLAQRQYAEVAVTVTPAPRNAAANPFGADAQGRGRQGGRDQEQQAPGLALFDDGPAATGFSLTGRE